MCVHFFLTGTINTFTVDISETGIKGRVADPGTFGYWDGSVWGLGGGYMNVHGSHLY